MRSVVQAAHAFDSKCRTASNEDENLTFKMAFVRLCMQASFEHSWQTVSFLVIFLCEGKPNLQEFFFFFFLAWDIFGCELKACYAIKVLFPLLQVWVHGCTLQTLIYREQRQVLWEFMPQRCNSRASDKGRVASSLLSRPLLKPFSAPACPPCLLIHREARPSVLKDVRLRLTCLTHLQWEIVA